MIDKMSKFNINSRKLKFNKWKKDPETFYGFCRRDEKLTTTIILNFYRYFMKKENN